MSRLLKCIGASPSLTGGGCFDMVESNQWNACLAYDLHMLPF